VHDPHHPSWLSSDDIHWFNEGNHHRLYQKLGAHATVQGGVPGTRFSVWAPNARSVHLIGSFNGWNREKNPLQSFDGSGIWAVFLPGVGPGEIYKYFIASKNGNYSVEKADPFAFATEEPPRTASVVAKIEHDWHDHDWMSRRTQSQKSHQPLSIYEVHLGSWMRSPNAPDRPLGYREIAPLLVNHVQRLGFTHVEVLPLTEHPFYGSWGYQTTGYFAPTSRMGSPDDLMFLIDQLHQGGIGVILDWVPSHFPSDEHSLGYFDGSHLFEHSDPRQGFHRDWNSIIFNYGRHEVRSFLVSSAAFWIEKYHIDGIRVDAVASMLYLDYSREPGDWIPNEHGGRENLEAIRFLRQLNAEIHNSFPGVITIAEESTAWPGVTRPVEAGGLGFDYKWDMGWMHDTLKHFPRDPIHRRHHQGELTFRSIYAFNENFVLPLSHDEVVHLKRSLLGKMWGDEWQRFACLRSLIAYQFTTPGKKLLFMGCEWGQTGEWNHDQSLDWHQLQWDKPRGMLEWTSDLARLYRNAEALHWGDCTLAGFEWITCDDATNGVLAWVRWNHDHKQAMVCVMGTTPVARLHYRMGFPWAGNWTEVLNSDAAHYGGSNIGNRGAITTHQGNHGIWAAHGEVAIPPLGFVIFEGRME